VPVIHLEAGLRSGNLSSPFPEELNRRVTSQITALHLAPTAASRENLLREGIPGEDVVITGNSVIDSLVHVTENRAVRFRDERLEALRRTHDRGESRRILLVTAHRRENFGAAMEDIGGAVADLARKYPDLEIVFPV